MSNPPDFQARKTVVRQSLTDTDGVYRDYVLLKNNSASATAQNNSLQGELDQLKSRLANIRQEGEKYDREFLDYSSNGANAFSYFGVRTSDEWALFIFFVSYVFLAICIIIYNYVVVTAYNIESLPLNIMDATAGGIMISAVLLRFV